MKTDERNPADWLAAAGARLRSADTLYAAEGPSAAVIELFQEAVERYLKGYLIARGWELERIHNLARLTDLAAGFDERFRAFADMAEALTEQFWEQHYPGGDLTEVGADYPELRRQAGELVGLIEMAVRT
jgi:HEPN domain-containing protein